MSDFRKRVLNPALIPVAAFVFIGALVFGFSRLLLAVPKDGSVILGILLAACILFGAGALSKGAGLKDSQRAALMAFAVLVVAGGVAAGTSLHVREVEGGPLPIGATLTAKGVAFDKNEFKLPAEKPVAIQFVNNDAGLAHNVAIYDTPAAAKSLLKGAVFPGVATRSYELEEGLPQGVYFFRCDIHPTQMTGRVIVGNASAPPAEPTPATSLSPTAAPSASPSGSPSAPAGAPTTLGLIAKGTAFDKKEIGFAAGQQITIDFDNQDAGQVHNFALYTDSSGSQPLFQGTFVTGPGKTKYAFKAPAAGTYFFRCDAHPTQMTGTATVT